MRMLRSPKKRAASVAAINFSASNVSRLLLLLHFLAAGVASPHFPVLDTGSFFSLRMARLASLGRYWFALLGRRVLSFLLECLVNPKSNLLWYWLPPQYCIRNLQTTFDYFSSSAIKLAEKDGVSPPPTPPIKSVGGLLLVWLNVDTQQPCFSKLCESWWCGPPHPKC